MSESGLRRRPTQARSRERVELILRTARELIGSRGNDAVSMREIAAEAGVPISSVYQYFPDKNAVLLAIMEGYYESIHDALEEGLSQVQSVDEFLAAVPALLKRFAAFFTDNPDLANIWAGIQAEPALMELDARDSYRNAARFTELLRGLLPELKKSEVQSFALYIAHTVGSVIRFALVVNEKDGRALMKETERLITLRVRDLEQLHRNRR